MNAHSNCPATVNVYYKSFYQKWVHIVCGYLNTVLYYNKESTYAFVKRVQIYHLQFAVVERKNR